MRLIIAAIILATALPLQAQAQARGCDGTVRGKNGLVKTGDTEGRIMKALGKPDRFVPFENKYGAYRGEEWIWYDTGFNPRTIRVIVSGTKAIAVCESKD